MNRIKRAAEALGVPMPHNVKPFVSKATAIVLAVMSLAFNVGIAEAATLGNSSVALSDPRPSATSSYTFTGGSAGALVTSGTIKCIKVTFSTSSTAITTPTGFTAAGAVVGASSTLINATTTGWTPTAGANTFSFTNATGITPATTTGATFILTGVANSSVADTSYFYKLSTFNNIDCATTPVDNASVMFINTNSTTVSLTVDQTLSFTVNAVAASQSCGGATSTQASTSTTVPFGTVTSAANGLVCQDLTAATNASSGFTIYTRYTGQLANGLPAQNVADWTGTNAVPTATWSPGTEAYGYTTNAATLGTGTPGRFTSNKYAAMTTTNSEVSFTPTGVTTSTNRIGHQVGISTVTKPGTYTTTVIYTCTPIY